MVGHRFKLKTHGIGNDVINWIEKWLTHRKQSNGRW